MVSIEQEWLGVDNEGKRLNYYDEIYKIKINEVSLRELLILLSFYVTNSMD